MVIRNSGFLFSELVIFCSISEMVHSSLLLFIIHCTIEIQKIFFFFLAFSCKERKRGTINTIKQNKQVMTSHYRIIGKGLERKKKE